MLLASYNIAIMGEEAGYPGMTEASVNRIHDVNEIRDVLQDQEVSDQLKSLGFEEVVFYGSAANGTAKDTSDLDIYAVHEGLDYSDFNTAYDRSKVLEKDLAKIISQAHVGEVVTGARDQAVSHERGGDLSGVIHVYFVPKNHPGFYDSETQKPVWVKNRQDEGIQIWSRNESPQK